MRSRLASFWSLLTDPAASVVGADERRQARLLAALLLALLPSAIVSVAVQAFVVPVFWPTLRVVLVAITLSLGAYALSRTRHHRRGAVVLTATVCAASIAVPLSNPADFIAFAFPVVGVLLACVLLSLRAAAIVAGSSLAGLIVLAIVLGDRIPLSRSIGPIMLVLIASVLILVTAAHRDRLEKDRHAELARSRERYRSLLETAFEGLIVAEGGVVVEANPGAARLFGRAEDAIVGGPLSDLVGDDGRGKRADGATFPVEMVTREASQSGHAVRIIAIRDVSEREQGQAQLMLTDRLASLGLLAAAVAHEINNPLSFVTTSLGSLDARLRKLAERRPEEPIEDLSSLIQKALDGAERVRVIARSLRTFARGADEQRGPFDVRQVIDSTIEIAAPEIRYRAKLVREYGEVAPVAGDASRLAQVFLNLLVNAAQAIPADNPDANQIRVKTAMDEQGRVIVEVTDTGAGIAPDVIGRVFEPFFTTKPAGVGTGLGLAICRELVAEMGGTIGVESQVGIGTTFRISVPAATAGARLRT